MDEMNLILPDIPRIYTAIAEWLACLQCILALRKRISGVKLAVVSAGMLALQSVFLVVTNGFDDIIWLLCMCGAVVIMYIYIYMCCDINRKDAGYYCMRAFVTAEFVASLEWQLECFLYNNTSYSNIWTHGICLIGVYTAVFTVSWLIYRNYMSEEEDIFVTNKELLACVIIGIAIFAMSNIGFTSFVTPFSGRQMAEIFNVRTIIDLGGVATLYAYHVQRHDLRVRHELKSMENVLHNQYIQYQQSQEAMDLINYKYHDLKHHIIALRAADNVEKRNEYLDKLEAEIKNYEAQNKTGNQVLDTLLTSKSLYCMKNDVTMTCVLDGTLFDFMDVVDICSIFGNALDNAIEYELKIPDKEKRLIHVSANMQKNFLIVRFENYYEGSLELESGLPKTSKKDASYHGYGLKSVRHTVHKYGGEVDISEQDNWFALKILIPR